MRSALWRSIETLALAFGFALCGAEGAGAASIDFSPISVTLTPPARVAQFTIRNPTENPLRLQIFGYAWTDDADGRIKLTPARDLIVYPQLITIPLFGKQEIRAAIVSPPSALEKTYRVVILLLPALTEVRQFGGSGGHLNIRVRYTLPIFQEPPAPRLSGRITTASARGGTVRFAIANSGNAHLGGDTIRIIGRDDAGRAIFSEPFQGWHVLTNNTQRFSFRAPQKGCRDVRSVTILPPPAMNVPPRQIEVNTGVCGA